MQKLYRLANIAGLDIDNLQHSLCIADAMNMVVGYEEEFIEYVRFFKSGISYVTKTERLDMLAVKFQTQKQNELLSEQREKAGIFTRNILEKLRISKNWIKENRNKYKLNEIFADNERVFSDKEVNAINAIGTINLVIELYETGKLREELKKIYIKNYAINSKIKLIGAKE